MAYTNVLLKLSGEALAGEGGSLSREAVDVVCRQIGEVVAEGCRLAVVVGGGNILRGRDVSETISVRATADQMGMLATMINGLAVLDGLERNGSEARLMSAVAAHQICEPFIRRRALRHQEKGRVIVLAGGTGNPFFTTDTTAALRASELGCDIMLKGTRVDGVYNADPETDPSAEMFDTLTYRDILEKQLKVMDLTAITMCMNHGLPIRVFNAFVEGNLKKVIAGESLGTEVVGASEA